MPNGSSKSEECGCREKSKSRTTTKERCRRQGENVEEMGNGKTVGNNCVLKVNWAMGNAVENICVKSLLIFRL